MNRLVGWMTVLLMAGAAVASAQETTGTIAGRIVDAQGLVVPGVTVTATGPQGAKTTVTDTEGRFTIPFLTSRAVRGSRGAAGLQTDRARGWKCSSGRRLTCRIDARGRRRSTKPVQVVASVPDDRSRPAPRSARVSTARRCRSFRSDAASATRFTSRRA